MAELQQNYHWYTILFMDDLKTGVLAIRINEGLKDDALLLQTVADAQ